MSERWTRRIVGIVFTTVAAVAVLWPTVAGAGGGGGHGSICPGFAEGSAIEMYDNCFAGTTHFVEPGAQITIKNSGSLPHSLTALDNSVDTGVLEPGETKTAQWDEPGIVRIFCTLHGSRDGGGMTGTVVVGDGGTDGTATVPVKAEPVSTRTAASAAPVRSDGLSGFAAVALAVAPDTDSGPWCLSDLEEERLMRQWARRSTLSAEPAWNHSMCSSDMVCVVSNSSAVPSAWCTTTWTGRLGASSLSPEMSIESSTRILL
jgi:plastocyanin